MCDETYSLWHPSLRQGFVGYQGGLGRCHFNLHVPEIDCEGLQSQTLGCAQQACRAASMEKAVCVLAGKDFTDI